MQLNVKLKITLTRVMCNKIIYVQYNSGSLFLFSEPAAFILHISVDNEASTSRVLSI